MFDRHAKPSPARQAALDRYSQLVDRLSPRSKMAQGLLRAFWVGGLICALGQGFIEIGLAWLDMTASAASTFASVMIVLLTALLTGVGVFDRIGQYAGAGAFVPISRRWSSRGRGSSSALAASSSPSQGRCWSGA